MDGVHDLGGLDGFGPVEHTSTERFFDEDWERRTFGLMVGLIATQGVLGGRFRHSIERMSEEQLAALVTRDAMIGVQRL